MKKSLIITMKVLFLFSISTLVSCNKQSKLSSEELLINSISEYLKDKLHDPNSYEFIELALVDTIFYRDNIEYRRNYFRNEISYSESQIVSTQNRLRERYLGAYLYSETQREGFRLYIDNLKSDIERFRSILTEIDSIEVALGDQVNNVASLTYLLRFRAKNAFGALTLHEYIVQTDPEPDQKIINMTDDEGKVYLNPNEFPGYQEMIKKYVRQ